MKKIVSLFIILSFLFGNIQFTKATGDIYSPGLNSYFPQKNQIIPIGNFNIILEYEDKESGIDTSSETITLQKWNENISDWWSDISSTGLLLGNKNITTSSAVYPTNNLNYGRYRVAFSIADIHGNTLLKHFEFYIDQISFSINTEKIEIGTLETNILDLSSGELEITVQTIGAPFRVEMEKEVPLSNGSDSIEDWNGSTGFWYDQENYTWNIMSINTPVNITTQWENLNLNGNLHTYSYKVRYGAVINTENFSAGEYETTLAFEIAFDYGNGQKRECYFDENTAFGCDLY